MIVRPTSASDCLAVREVVLSSVDSSREVYTDAQVDMWRQSLSSKDFATTIEETFSFVAVRDNVVIGFANLITRQEREGELDLLYVGANHCRTGVGGALVAVVEREARAEAMTHVWADASLLATSLLESLGYRVVERYSKSLNGVTFENSRLVKAPDA